jgi:hypothetical protein
METVSELYHRVRELFPQVSQSADACHRKRWGATTLPSGVEYSWFEALAEALNADMRQDVPYMTHDGLFRFIEGSFSQGAESVRDCIDVAFVECLFWHVPGQNCASYWQRLPHPLKRLYTEFHHHEPGTPA